MISCEKSSFLIEKKLADVISMKERSQLFVHKLICDICRKYEKQSKRLDILLRAKIYGNASSLNSNAINESTVNRLKLTILNKLNKF